MVSPAHGTQATHGIGDGQESEQTCRHTHGGIHNVEIQVKRRWRADEDAQLRRLAALQRPKSAIAQDLKRTPRAVQARAAELGVVLPGRGDAAADPFHGRRFEDADLSRRRPLPWRPPLRPAPSLAFGSSSLMCIDAAPSTDTRED